MGKQECLSRSVELSRICWSRGAALTRVGLAGCTVSEIASITGHNFKTVQEILGKYYLGRRLELAEAAIKKLDAVYRRSTKSTN